MNFCRLMIKKIQLCSYLLKKSKYGVAYGRTTPVNGTALQRADDDRPPGNRPVSSGGVTITTWAADRVANQHSPRANALRAHGRQSRLSHWSTAVKPVPRRSGKSTTGNSMCRARSPCTAMHAHAKTVLLLLLLLLF